MLSVVTWNVNSITARLERLLNFLEKESPDVVCLQELKCIEERFPAEEIGNLGYGFIAQGQKTYNGVAILSKHKIENPRKGFNDPILDEASRLIRGTIKGVEFLCAYFPNGQAVGTEKYHYKLSWMKALRKLLDAEHSSDNPVCLLGDFNVAPEDIDVHDPKAWEGQVLCSELERQHYRSIAEFGFVDVFRKHHPEGNHYSWWDYRMLCFPKNNGLRIDLVLATPSLAKNSVEAKIHRDERKGTKPSDHAPVEVKFKI